MLLNSPLSRVVNEAHIVSHSAISVQYLHIWILSFPFFVLTRTSGLITDY